MPLATSTSALPETLETSLIVHDEEKVDVSPCLDHLYVPHGRSSRFFGRKLRCLGKGVMLRAGRATTCYLRKVSLGAQAIAIVSKIWNIWDGFHKELYLYGHPLHLRPLQGICVPNVIGVFDTSEGLANMAMEPPHPHAWRVADRWLSADEKRAIVEAYAQIHARGVLHRDVALRHMLVGRDGKATIINFRHASCLPPAAKIGLSGCSTYDFQLEMRQVKFLLDYQDAREAEYRLAGSRRSATRLNAREGVAAPLPIPETTLRQWDASALEDLRSPTLPFYVPNAPNLSIHPVSWILTDNPLSADDLPNHDSVEEQLQTSAISRIPLAQGRSGQVDDGDIQSPPSPSHPHSARKGKRPEYDCNSDDVDCAPRYKRPRLKSSITSTEERFPDTHLIGSEQGHPIASASLTSLPSLGPGIPSYLASDTTPAPRSAAISLDIAQVSRFPALPNQLPPSSLPCCGVEPSSPSSCISTSLVASPQVPPPGHALSHHYSSCPQVEESEAHDQLPPQLDYTLDSSSDSSLLSTDTSYGSWVDSQPDSPSGALVMLEDEHRPFCVNNTSNGILIFDSSLEADIEPTGVYQLDAPRPSLKTGESIAVPHKRKLLFLADEDEYEGRTCKKRSIER